MSEQTGRVTSIGDILAILLKRKWLIVIPWILVSLAAWGGSYLLTPQYESFSIVSIDPNVRLSGELQRMLGIDPNFRMSNSQLQAMLKGLHNEMTSTPYVARLNERLRLGEQPVLVESARKIVQAQRAQGIPVTEELVILTMLQADLQERIGVASAGEDQIRIGAISSSQTEARDIANTIADIFIEERLKQELTSIRSSQDFSDVQLEKYEKQLSDLIGEKTRLERSVMNIQLDDRITSEANRTEVGGELDRTKNDIEDYSRTERAALTAINAVQGLNVTRLALTETTEMTEDREELRKQVSQYGENLTRYVWSDPSMVNARLRQNSLIKNLEVSNKRQVDAQFASYADDIRSHLTTLFNTRLNLEYFYGKKIELETANSALTDRRNAIPDYQAKLDRLNREIAAATELRDKFKQQQESSNISQALAQDLSTSKYRKVEPAKLALAPFSPNRIKVAAMGILLGLVIGGAAAILAELFDHSFRKAEEISDYLGLPVIGVMPKVEALRKT